MPSSEKTPGWFEIFFFLSPKGCNVLNLVIMTDERREISPLLRAQVHGGEEELHGKAEARVEHISLINLVC